jgi:hypothetical protein
VVRAEFSSNWPLYHAYIAHRLIVGAICHIGNSL